MGYVRLFNRVHVAPGLTINLAETGPSKRNVNAGVDRHFPIQLSKKWTLLKKTHPGRDKRNLRAPYTRADRDQIL